MNTGQVLRDIFVYQIDNRIAPDLGNSLDLTIKNSNLLSLGNKTSSHHKTKYTLIITNISSLGFTNTDQASVETFYNRLILAFNLVFKRAVLSTFDIIYSQLQMGSESIRAVIGFHEEIDEHDVLNFLTLLNNLEQKSQNTSVQINNLRKSLESYQNAMYSNLAVLIFKDLYNSLELAINSDGKNRIDNDLDNEISSITGVLSGTVESWRKFYNRIKHADRNSSDLNKYLQGKTNLNEDIRNIRKVVQEALKNRLKLV